MHVNIFFVWVFYLSIVFSPFLHKKKAIFQFFINIITSIVLIIEYNNKNRRFVHVIWVLQLKFNFSFWKIKNLITQLHISFCLLIHVYITKRKKGEKSLNKMVHVKSVGHLPPIDCWTFAYSTSLPDMVAIKICCRIK